MITYLSSYVSPFGPMTMASRNERLVGLWFDGQKHFASTVTGRTETANNEALRECRRWLDIYFGGREPDFTPPLELIGTEFRKKVWNALLSVPYGETSAYKKLAELIGNTSARAVGGAVGRNPISIIVPCHRIIGADGSITGYAAGVDIKKKLIDLERHV